MPIEEISPMKLAKELGIRPQQIYGLIRKGRINSWEDKKTGKTVVGREEATNALSSPMKRGPKTDKTTVHDVEGVGSPVQTGDIVSWRTREGVRVTQVKQKDPPFNFMADLHGKQVFFRNHSLRKRIEEGVAKVEQPTELLNMIAWQFQQWGEEELFMDMISWTMDHKAALERAEQQHGRTALEGAQGLAKSS